MRQLVLLIVDLALMLSATACALFLRENFQVSASRVMDMLPYFLATVVCAAAVFPVVGLNRALWRFSGLQDHMRVTGAIAACAVCAAIVAFAYNRLDGVARSLPFLQVLTATAFLTGARVLYKLAHERRHHRKTSATLLKPGTGGGVETVLIVGMSRLAETYLQAIAEFASGHVQIAGLVGRAERHAGRIFAAQPILGVPEDIGIILDKLEVHGVVVDRIVIAAPFTSFSVPAREALLLAADSRNIKLSFLAKDLNLDFDTEGPGGDGKMAEGSSVIGYPKQSFAISDGALARIAGRRYWAAKRMGDLCGAALLVVLLSPLIMLTALLVAASVGPPILFWQQRPGLGGGPFRVYKFRSLRAAQDREGRTLSEAERSSTIGNTLRRLRLDELPQLYNILRGDMSFVGPRPLLPCDQAQDARARLLVRPGLSGWAQVIGGRTISPTQKATLDIWYVCHASLALDLEIILRTIPMVLFGERIYFALVERASRDLREIGVLKEREI